MSDRQRQSRPSDREKREGPLDPDDNGDEAPEDESDSKSARFAGLKKGRTTGRFASSGQGETAAKPATGKMKKVKKPKEEEKALELEAISPFSRGISIGVKFAALTAVVVAMFMALLGFLTYSITVQEVNDQINQGGISASSALAEGVDRIPWVKPDEIVDDLMRALCGEQKPDPQSPNFAEQQKLWDNKKQHIWDELKSVQQRELSAQLNTLVEQSKSGEAGTKQILSAGIVEKVGEKDVDAWALSSSKVGVNVSRLTTSGNVEISEGSANVDGVQTLIRRFDKPIMDSAGNPVAPRNAGAKVYAMVFVNAEKIDEVKDKVMGRIALVTALGALAGVFLTALIAALLTKPIRTLEGDIAAVAGGDLEHETKPQSHDEIGALAHTFNIMTRNLRAAQQHAVDRKAIERELAIATEIQTKLLPERIPQIPGLDIHSFYLSAKEVGGDYYDFIVIDQTHLGIIVADVSGKGIPGSMVMTMARSLVRLASVRNVSPADTFKKVNRILAKDIRRGMFVTSMYMVLNVKTYEMKVASAGHNPLVVYRAETDQYELCKPQGIALGFDKGTIFDSHVQEVELTLKPGDRIVAYTDGVNEAMNAESEEFGDERFYNLVRQHAKLSSKDCVNAIVEELKAHRGDAEQSDDITITTLAVLK
ncbi:SpoIIE family protein phosphatase [bacterium]|nr:SpoIIE family protein phosphatase [bacterium]